MYGNSRMDEGTLTRYSPAVLTMDEDVNGHGGSMCSKQRNQEDRARRKTKVDIQCRCPSSQ
jgi:hypothetical protein